jgi:hypothetical protein
LRGSFSLKIKAAIFKTREENSFKKWTSKHLDID